MITIEVAGKEYTDFVSASAVKSLDKLCGTFQFSATSTPSQQADFPLKAGQKCRILTDGTQFMLGYIEAVSVNYSADGHMITVQGRG